MKTPPVSLAIALLLLLLLGPSSPPRLQAESPPEEGPLLSLEEAQRAALERNRQLDNARLELEKAGDQVEASRRNYLPVFDVQVSQSYFLTNSDYTFQKGVFGNYPGVGPIPGDDVKIPTVKGWDTLLSASVAQPLTQLYRIGLGVEALEIGREVAERQYQVGRRETVAEVRRQYYGLAQTQCALEAAREISTTSEELERVVSERVSQRTALDAELLEVRAQRARADYDLLKLRNALVLGKQQMNHFLGRDPTTPFSVAPVWASLPEIPKEGPTAPPLSQDGPGLEALRLRVRQAELAMEIKRMEAVPDLSLVATYVSPFNSDFLPKNVLTVGLQLNWDFFDWGRRQWEITERGRALRQARNQLLEAEARHSVEVQQHLLKMREAAALVRVSELTQQAAREKLRVATERYRLPAVLLQEVLQAQAAYAEANAQLRGAILGYLTAGAELEKLVGGNP